VQRIIKLAIQGFIINLEKSVCFQGNFDDPHLRIQQEKGPTHLKKLKKLKVIRKKILKLLRT